MDERDELWNATFEVFYDSFYEELASEALIHRWQIVDDLTKVLVALTASGSALAGWTLWDAPGLRFVWSTLAGLAAALAIVHAALGIPGRLKNWTETKQCFIALRVDIDTFRALMRIEPDFSLSEFTSRFVGLRGSYKNAITRVNDDALRTQGLRVKVQNQLNARLCSEILEPEEE